MSKLETLVPPLELCKKIPEGCFADSTLVWFGHPHTDKTMQAVPRNELGAVCKRFLRMNIRVAYAAPTLAEIMGDIGKMGYFCPTVYHLGRWHASCEEASDTPTIWPKVHDADDPSAAAAALKLWLELEKVDHE